MKRVIFSVLGALIAIGAMRGWLRPGGAPSDPTAVVPATVSPPPVGAEESPADPLASLAAVEWAASETAVAGTPSSIPAIPSIPSFASARRHESLNRTRT